MTLAYGSATLSLAALEFLVHAEVKLLSTIPLVSCEMFWPDDLRVEVVAAGDLPPGWRNTPPLAAMAALGDAWVREGSSAILLLPSVVVPSENNVLINPDHPDARHLKFGTPEGFSYDPRLL